MFLKIYIYNFSCDNFAVVRFLSGYYNLLSLASEIVLKFLLFFLWKAIHICTAESFYHSRDTITLLIGYIPIENFIQANLRVITQKILFLSLFSIQFQFFGAFFLVVFCFFYESLKIKFLSDAGRRF